MPLILFYDFPQNVHSDGRNCHFPTVHILPLYTNPLCYYQYWRCLEIFNFTLKFIPHLPMSKGDYSYYQKVHKILFMPSSIMFMLKCNSIYYHREHKKRLLPISNYDFTLMLISNLIKIYVKVGSPEFVNEKLFRFQDFPPKNDPMPCG